MPSIFDDILERAEKLHADANLGNISDFPAFSGVENKNDGVSSLNFDIGLADIFRQSEDMWKQKSLKRDPSSSLAALKVSKNVSQLRATALPISSTPSASFAEANVFDATAVATGETSYDDYSTKEIERYVESSFERARIESERTFFNQQLVDQSELSGSNGELVSCDPFGHLRRGTPIAPGSSLNQPLAYLENLFAQKVDIALYKNCNALIKDAVKEAVDEANDKDVTNIWSKAFAICSRSLIEDSESVAELRSSRKWYEHVVDKSTTFLHECFNTHMEIIVENALELANRGGVPGTIPLIEAFLNVKRILYSSIEDGNYNKHPIWTVLFNCLRAGDFDAAAQVAKKLFNVSRCSILISVLANLHNTKRVDPETKIKLSAEWRQCSSLCHDVYKKAVYGVFLGFDCPEVNGTIEDWLWARLMFCKLHSKDLISSFRQLQTTVCAEFGENYFVHNGGSFIIYYAALMLTGQLEQAIVALFRAKLLVHAVHIAILAYQLKLIVLSNKISSDILTTDVHNPTICQLNFARIVLLYMKNFELTNINYALNYSFFLNKLELDDSIDSKGGRNVFKSCVSRIVYLTGERDQILGKFNLSSERTSGLIDKFSSAFSISDIIGYVASDTNSCGDTLEACKLFALAEQSNEAIKLTCRQMSFCISAAAKNIVGISGDLILIETVEFAQWLTERYRTLNNKPGLEKHNLSTLCLLIDLYTFFERIAEHKFDTAVNVIRKLQFIPMSPEEVQSYVNAFEMVPEEVRLLLPEICTALMKAIVALYEIETSESPTRTTLAAQAKSLILYSAMVPYRFPVSTNSLLLQLQAKIA